MANEFERVEIVTAEAVFTVYLDLPTGFSIEAKPTSGRLTTEEAREKLVSARRMLVEALS